MRWINQAASGLVLALLLTGCGLDRIRPYQAWEADHFRNVTLPTSNEIRTPGSALNEVRYDYSFDQVWDACLALVTQGAGVLGLSRTRTGEGQILFVASVPLSFLPQYAHKAAGEVRLDLVESWIAINVAAGPDDVTRVTLASVAPDSGRVRPTNTIQTDDEVVAEQTAIARLAAVQFQTALSAQLRAPRMAARLAPLPARKLIRGGPLPESTPRANWAEHAEQFGDYVSATARSQLYLVDNLELTRRLNEMAQRILTAAGKPGIRARVFVHAADSGKPAFSLSNGDVFLKSLLLEAPNDMHHVAAVLAHELDHVIQQDHIKREEEQAKDLSRKMNLLVGATAIAATAVVADDPDAWLEDSGETEDAVIRLGGVAAIFGAMAAAGVIGTEYGEFALGDYSREQELRADSNAAIYLWRAGFRPGALLEVLEQ